MSAILPTPASSTSVARPIFPPALTRFWRWWMAELKPVVGPLVARYWVDRSASVDLTIDTNGSVTGLASPGRPAPRDVRLVLPQGVVLQKLIQYPAVVEENLDEVVATDLDRQTPFKATDLFHTQRVLRRFDGSDGVSRIEVELTVVPKRVVEPAIAQVRQAGSSVMAIGVAGMDRAVDLLPRNMLPPRRLTSVQRLNVALASALVLLIVGAIAIPIWQRRAEVLRLTPIVEKARNEAEATRRIDTELQRLASEHQLVTTRKYQAPAVIDIIEELSRLSPDTTWLQSLEMKAPTSASKSRQTRELLLVGEAASASKMIELLEQSPLLQNTTQRAQTTRGAQPNTERFQIASELRPRTLPEPMVLSAPAAPPAAASNAAPASTVPAPQAATAPVATAQTKGESKPANGKSDTPPPTSLKEPAK
jgi:general secretion pathway protein L